MRYMASEVQHILMYMLHIRNTQITLVFHNFQNDQIFPNAQIFYGEPDPLYSTQYSDLFVTYANGFNMHTGQPNQSIFNEYISGKIVLDNSNNKIKFPALNVSKNFATIDYDAHTNTKIDYTVNHVFRSMTVQEINTLHTKTNPTSCL